MFVGNTQSSLRQLLLKENYAESFTAVATSENNPDNFPLFYPWLRRQEGHLKVFLSPMRVAFLGLHLGERCRFSSMSDMSVFCHVQTPNSFLNKDTFHERFFSQTSNVVAKLWEPFDRMISSLTLIPPTFFSKAL